MLPRRTFWGLSTRSPRNCSRESSLRFGFFVCSRSALRASIATSMPILFLYLKQSAIVFLRRIDADFDAIGRDNVYSRTEICLRKPEDPGRRVIQLPRSRQLFLTNFLASLVVSIEAVINMSPLSNGDESPQTCFVNQPSSCAKGQITDATDRSLANSPKEVT
jgi:hypothetical protein